MPFIGLADASGIQRFLLRSPELKKIATASQRLEGMCLPGGLYYDTPAECLVAAGGNAVLRADTHDCIFAAFQQISRTLLENGDDLQVIGCIEEYTDGDLPRAYYRALRRLDQRKLSQPRSTEFIFSGLTPPLPDPTSYKSSNSHVPSPPKHSSLRVGVNDYWEPQQFNDVICRSAETTDLMAVVSVDGIGMGKKLNRWLAGNLADRARRSDNEVEHSDAQFIEEFRAWSKSLKVRWQQAWEAAVSAIAGVFDQNNSFTHPFFEHRTLELKRRPQGGAFLPCRHIYQGGDDLSFVCDARLALSLTERLLQHLRDFPAEGNIPELFQSIPASAGIVFVNSHFPFARAISLSEQVRQSAKVKAQEDDSERPVPALSWWVNRSGAMTFPKPLFDGATQKPYLLESADGELSWRGLNEKVMPSLWRTFGTSRNKLKDVLAAAEASDKGTSVRRLLQQRPLRDSSGHTILAPFSWESSEVAAQSGFNGSGQTLLIDTGEIYDIYFPCFAARQQS
jgi:hypothetical protein